MGVDLSCVSITVEELLQCTFGLSRQETRILVNLLSIHGWAGVSRIASSLHRDRSVIQRGLSRLLSKSLIEREQANRLQGGYEFVYRAKDKTQMKKAIISKSRAFSMMITETVRDW